MSDNSQKIPLTQSLNRFAAKRIAEADQLLGRSLPCSVVSVVSSMVVTVKLEIKSIFTPPTITVPVAGSEYARQPIQAGCKGFLVPADAQLGAMSGLGSGVADLTIPANLSACVFVPFGNTNFFAVDTNSFVIYGPDGVIIRDMTTAANNVTLNGSAITVAWGSNTISINGSQAEMVFGSNSIVVNAAGIALNGPIFFNGVVSGATTGAIINLGSSSLETTGTLTAADATLDGRVFSAHAHSGVSTGTHNTGPIV